MNPEQFDLDGTKDKQLTAEKLCAGCPVLQDCAIDALANGDVGVVRAGVWIPSYISGGHFQSAHYSLLRYAAGMEATNVA
ncbi:WhiB family transcriptional regulator [Corynebacterium incognita]|uniref:WhiB family transcriptional regulator n=2 Tax=Corynebacterium incognita TaxID=2754725 RepID=A0A7G7CRQ7_9CORY|nr:WhiB family transcriptional regulator [Corynebacterium incognita]